MHKAFLTTVGFLLLASLPAWADSPSCPGNKPHKGIDFSLPCVLLSPIEEADAKAFFSYGSAQLTMQAKTTLDRQAAILRAYPELLVITEGFIDSKESRAEKKSGQLALKRALTVREYLIHKGIADERIEALASPTPALIPRQEDKDTLANMRFVRTRTQER